MSPTTEHMETRAAKKRRLDAIARDHTARWAATFEAVSALRKHGAANAFVAQWGCLAVSQHAFDLRSKIGPFGDWGVHHKNLIRLGEAGACVFSTETFSERS